MAANEQSDSLIKSELSAHAIRGDNSWLIIDTGEDGHKIMKLQMGSFAVNADSL